MSYLEPRFVRGVLHQSTLVEWDLSVEEDRHASETAQGS